MADTNPGDGNADQLHRYWVAGPGLAKWKTKPRPWTALYKQLHRPDRIANEMMAKATASKWFREVFGYASGSDLHRVNSGKPPRGKVIGPG